MWRKACCPCLKNVCLICRWDKIKERKSRQKDQVMEMGSCRVQVIANSKTCPVDHKMSRWGERWKNWTGLARVRKVFFSKQPSWTIISGPHRVVILGGVGCGWVTTNPYHIPAPNSLEILLSMPVWRTVHLGAVLIGAMSQPVRWRTVSGMQSHCLTWCGENIRLIHLNITLNCKDIKPEDKICLGCLDPCLS